MLENRSQYMGGHDEQRNEEEGRDGSSIKIHALKELTLALLKEVETMKEGRQLDGARVVNFSDEVRRFEIDLIRWALMRTGGHQRRAARLLNIKVTTLNAKIKRFNLRPGSLPVSNVVDFYPEAQRS